eukprot:TRINITY_DN1526_c0_g2_i1.p1 TRINITY_DN1526_c0_g2~~TRINITY_DN1526_c0_g2_i1.p1  ORF type:complete len:560 (+),score=89.94 TRINITY_DN1526_c0_g2_i1:54-1733(+)
MIRCVVVVVALCLISAVCGDFVNFEWSSIKVYGQNSTMVVGAPYLLNLTEDFIVQASGQIQAISAATTTTCYITSFNINTTGVTSRTTSNLLIWGLAENSNQSSVLYSLPLQNNNPGFQLIRSGTSLAKQTNTANPIINSPTGMAWDPRTNMVYVSDRANCKVVCFQLMQSTNNFGWVQRETYGSCSSTPTASSLNVPRKLALDCNGGGFWVADTINNRVLHFAFNSSTADIVLGQTSFISRQPGVNPRQFSNPSDVALTSDCSLLFVADQNRVLKFRAPFTSGQAAEGVLGFSDLYTNATNVITDSTFNNVFALQYVDTEPGYGTLYVLDRGNFRILSGITNIKPPTTVPIYCEPSSTFNGGCTIIGNITVLENQTLTLNYTNTQIQGDVNLGNSTLELNNQTITLTGTIQFGGTLVVHVNLFTNGTSEEKNVTLIKYNASRGTFDEIQIISSGGQDNCNTDVNEVYGSNSLGLVLNTVCKGNNGGGGGGDGGLGGGGAGDGTGGGDGGDGTKRNMIIGITAGIGGFVVLIIVVAIVVFTASFVFAKKRASRPSRIRV